MVWGIGLLPFDKLPISQYWQVLSYRTLSIIFSFTMMWIFAPHSLKRFTLRIPIRRLGVALLVLAFIIISSLINSSVATATPSQIIAGICFTLFIGLDEELFSRGLIFGIFENFGTGIAVMISSLHFGLLHLTNIFWAGQSFSYTASQVLYAAAFGFLSAGLLIFSGSIWIPILLHTFADLPMQFITASETTHIVSGDANWISTFARCLVYCAIGSFLLFKASNHENSRWLKVMTKFGLVEPPKINQPLPEVGVVTGRSVA